MLISSAAKKIPLLQAVRQAMAKLDSKGKIIIADQDEKCLARYFADDFWQMPLLDKITPEKLLSNLQQYGVRYVIPTRDGELLFWSECKAYLEEHGIAVMVAESESIKRCLDKVLFYQICKRLSIPAIETESSLDGLNAEWFVVKERYGAGSHHIGVKLSSEQAKLHACQLSYPIFQPFVRGREYSADAYVNKQGQIQGIVCRSRDIVVNGESQVTTTVKNTVLEELCAHYIGRLGLYGHVVLQVLVDEQGHMAIIECNARFGGASTMSIAAGLDSFYWFLLESRGENLQQYPFCRLEQQLRQIRYPQDLIMEVTQ